LQVSIAYNKAYMVGHQLVISLAYYNNNLTLQLYFSGSITCYLEEVTMLPKNLLLGIRGMHVHPLAPACGRPWHWTGKRSTQFTSNRIHT